MILQYSTAQHNKYTARYDTISNTQVHTAVAPVRYLALDATYSMLASTGTLARYEVENGSSRCRIQYLCPPRIVKLHGSQPRKRGRDPSARQQYNTSRTWLEADRRHGPQPPSTRTTNVQSTGRTTGPSLGWTPDASLCLHPAPCLCHSQGPGPLHLGRSRPPGPAVPPTPIGERLEIHPHDSQNVQRAPSWASGQTA